MILVSLATDGGDGPTDAAGAVATNQTYSLGLAKGLDPADYLQRNDSYNYFDQLGDLIKIGPTLTNVNDLLFIFGVIGYSIFTFRNRKLLLTTNTLLKAIAPAASIGFNRPNAAAGIKITL